MPNWACLLSLFGKEFNVCTDSMFAEIQHYINPSGSLPASFFSSSFFPSLLFSFNALFHPLIKTWLDSPNALVLTNTGQTVWYNSGWSAITADSFYGQHRSSAVERKSPLNASRNVIGNGSIGEHIENIFHQVLMRGHFRVGAMIDIIGMSEGGHATSLL
ncbi:hypothetical protein ACN38_g7783 [Penicillium nordicum]|uniref:Arb2 domain-containing protein n=1 Tax=Penicillium nordicum TaxID=229535 RepID=A0A0M9WE17_9EURO|nr:hypothetical protein ACN38_g7783 [Penicillium nordicum]